MVTGNSMCCDVCLMMLVMLDDACDACLLAGAELKQKQKQKQKQE